MNASSRPPFKAPPMRQPGQSIVQGMRNRIAYDMIPVIAILGGIGFVLGLPAGAYLYSISPSVLLIGELTGIGLVVVAAIYTCRRFRISEERDRMDRLGASGERIVAEALDELKRDGYRVFHDVPPEREAGTCQALANYDHVVIGPAGVFVIETKTRSKRDRNNQIEVTADGRVLVNGHESDRSPLTQAKALAKAMQSMLEQQTAVRDVPVRAVVIFPGWFIRDRAYRDAGGDVWTLTETAFAKWVRSPKEHVRLNADQIALLSSRVELLARSEAGE